MKKSIFVLLLPLLATSLAGCVKYNGKGKDKSSTSVTPPDTNPPTSEPIPVEPGADVTYYLNLGRFGKLDGAAGTVQAEVFLEYGVKISGKSGDKLPTKDKVSSAQDGVVFEGWLLNGTQDAYTEVPNLNNCILVAVFASNGGSSGGGGSGETLPTTGFGFLFDNNKYYLGQDDGYDYDGRQQKRLDNISFKKGEKFRLYDFGNSAGWAINLDPYSLGGTDSSSTTWQQYLSVYINESDRSQDRYTVLKDFTSSATYIKLAPAPLGDLLYIGL